MNRVCNRLPSCWLQPEMHMNRVCNSYSSLLITNLNACEKRFVKVLTFCCLPPKMHVKREYLFAHCSLKCMWKGFVTLILSKCKRVEKSGKELNAGQHIFKWKMFTQKGVSLWIIHSKKIWYCDHKICNHSFQSGLLL